MLNKKQQRCIQLMVVQGWTQRDIAKELKITEQTICNWKKLPDFAEAYQKATKQELNTLAAEAVRTIRHLMRNSSSDAIRLNAARDVLNRSGFEPIEYKRVDRPDFLKEEHDGPTEPVIYLPEKEIDEDTMITGSEPFLRSTVKRMSDRRKKELLQILNEED